jgi:N-acetylglucosamine kinase-like BadF-type ATPase
MSNKYYVSMDSGGSKLRAILYDDSFHMLSSAVVGSVRGSTTPPSQCNHNLDLLLSKLFGSYESIGSLECVRGMVEPGTINKMKARLPITQVIYDGELRIGLSAAGIGAPGLLCLSGTGSFSTYMKADGTRGGGMGGYGALVFDEGSGYHIGRMAYAAAIRCDEGRGSQTLLLNYITEHFKKKNFREAIFGVYEDSEFGSISAIASLSTVVSRAAYDGDETARRILEHAGVCLGEQMNAVIRRWQVPTDVSVTTSGGTFYGHPALYKSFLHTLRTENPDRPVCQPIFEPVVGGVLTHWLASGRLFDDRARDLFTSEYEIFLIKYEDRILC